VLADAITKQIAAEVVAASAPTPARVEPVLRIEPVATPIPPAEIAPRKAPSITPIKPATAPDAGSIEALAIAPFDESLLG
jgi:hypothetical protein